MSTSGMHTPNAYIVRRDGKNVVVSCPYCGKEHTHILTAGHVPAAICGGGPYQVIEVPDKTKQWMCR